MTDRDVTDRRTEKCRYCLTGNVANERGEHWIVKRIIPGKIDIRKCTAIEVSHD